MSKDFDATSMPTTREEMEAEAASRIEVTADHLIHPNPTLAKKLRDQRRGQGRVHESKPPSLSAEERAEDLVRLGDEHDDEDGDEDDDLDEEELARIAEEDEEDTGDESSRDDDDEEDDEDDDREDDEEDEGDDDREEEDDDVDVREESAHVLPDEVPTNEILQAAIEKQHKTVRRLRQDLKVLREVSKHWRDEIQSARSKARSGDEVFSFSPFDDEDVEMMEKAATSVESLVTLLDSDFSDRVRQYHTSLQQMRKIVETRASEINQIESKSGIFSRYPSLAQFLAEKHKRHVDMMEETEKKLLEGIVDSLARVESTQADLGDALASVAEKSLGREDRDRRHRHHHRRHRRRHHS